MINFYYDIITPEGRPVPNGVSEYYINHEHRNMPYNPPSLLNTCFRQTTEFYNTMLANTVEVNLFTGKQTAKNLFYPLEYTGHVNQQLLSKIPEKTISKIRKQKMKILLLMQDVVANISHMEAIKQKLDSELDEFSIAKSQVYIVTGEVTNVYSSFFKEYKMFSIDWWQISYQLTAKSRYLGEDYYWVNLKRHNLPNRDTLFDIDAWNNFEDIFVSFTGQNSLHNLCFYSELMTRNLLDKGKASFNIFKQEPRNIDFTNKDIIPNHWIEPYLSKKKNNLTQTATLTSVIDYDIDTFSGDNKRIDNELLSNSAFSIISDSFCSTTQSKFPEEIDAMYVSDIVYKHIALGHPFMILGSHNTWVHLNNEGYFSFLDMFDHKYDRTASMYRKIELICDNIERFASLSKLIQLEKIKETKKILKINRSKFFKKTHFDKFSKLIKEIEYE